MLLIPAIEETPPWQLKLVPEKHSGEIVAINISDHLLVTASSDRTSKVVDLQKRQVVRVIRGHTDKVMIEVMLYLNQTVSSPSLPMNLSMV